MSERYFFFICFFFATFWNIFLNSKNLRELSCFFFPENQTASGFLVPTHWGFSLRTSPSDLAPSDGKTVHCDTVNALIFMRHSLTHSSIFLGEKNKTLNVIHILTAARHDRLPLSLGPRSRMRFLILTRTFALLSRFMTSAQKADAAARFRCRTDSKLLSSLSIRRRVDDGQAVISHGAVPPVLTGFSQSASSAAKRRATLTRRPRE